MNTKILQFIPALLALGLATSASAQAMTQTITPPTQYYIAAAKDATNYLNEGTGAPNTGGNRQFVGTMNVDTNTLRRSFFNFDVSTLTYGSGADITSATLRLYVNSASASRDLQIFSNTLSAETDMAVSSFQNTDWTNTGLSVSALSSKDWYEFDVTTLVQGAYDHGTNNIVSFRLQLHNDTTIAFGTYTNTNIDTFQDSGARQPELVVVPEPATYAMMVSGLAFLLVLMRRTRR